jgi:hypothetical protein
VRDIAKALGFDSKQGSQFWNQMAARGGAVTPDTLMRRDVALDLLKFRDSFQDPKAVGVILKAVDKLTNFTKGMYTGVWPAFHTRNAISGFFQNILTGTMGPAEAVARTVDAYNLIRGQTVKGAASIPAVAQRLAAQGRALTDEEGTKVLREMAAAHELAGKYEHAGASVVGNIAGKRPGVLQDIVQSIPGLEPVSWRTTLQRAAGATPDTTPLKFWRQRGVIEEGTKKFGLAAAGEDLGYVIESVNRIAPFIAQLRNGVDDTVAAMKIGASQARYANRHFTPFELEKMQRLFPFYKFCVDSSHEILTRRGWKRYTELVIGEEVLTFNQETETLQWEPLLNVHVFNHNGPINQYEQSRKGKKIRFRFTDGHRWPVKQPACVLSSGRAQRAYRYIRLGSELRLNDCFYRSGEFHGRDTILSPRHAALLGWIVTDGHFRWKRVKGANYAEAVIYQSPKKHLDEVVALTGSSRRAPHPDTGVVAVNVKSIDLAVITEHFKSRSDLPRIACHLSRESAEAMYDAMIKAEGTIYDSGRTMFYQYEQNEVLEAFQILCQLTGRSANYCQQGCTVSRPKFYYNVGTRISQVDYSGKVWCPETPSGTWVMRSDGNVVITGNSSQMMPWFLKTLVTEPGGRLAQTIRAVAGARQPSDIVPDYVAETTSIPATGALESILGKPPKGTDRYISGLGMMYEDPLGFFGSGIRGLGLETISRMNPLVKFPLEWSFGESTFQKGPMGGRELLDQDPLIGRILANVKENATGEKTKHAPKVGGGFTEAMAANSPISRILSSIRVATDPRKNLASKAAVLGTGIRIADVSEGAKESKIRELADPMMRELGAKAFTRTYFPADVVASMSPQERAAAMQYQALMNALAKRQKERVANAKRTS